MQPQVLLRDACSSAMSARYHGDVLGLLTGNSDPYDPVGVLCRAVSQPPDDVPDHPNIAMPLKSWIMETTEKVPSNMIGTDGWGYPSPKQQPVTYMSKLMKNRILMYN